MHEVRRALIIAARHLSVPIASVLSLGAPERSGWRARRSSATFTTFGALEIDAHYWTGELPLEADLLEDYVKDYAWASLGPVRYEDVAHLLIPRFFTQDIHGDSERGTAPRFVDQWTHEQDINGLSCLLGGEGISHYLTKQVLEIKRF